MAWRPVDSSTASQLAHGPRLARAVGTITASDSVVRADEPVATAVRKVIGRQLLRLRSSEPGTRLGTDPEALHDLRVAIRRLRAAVRAFGPSLPWHLRRSLRTELQWVGQLTGNLRDLDVQVEHLRLYRTRRATYDSGLSQFGEYLAAEHASRRRKLLTALESRRYLALLARMERYVAGQFPQARGGPETREPVALAGRRGIKAALRRLRRRGDTIHGTPRPEDLHVLRIRAKRLRYQLEFLDDITGKTGQRLVKRLVVLQDVLGAYHDAVVAAGFVERYLEGPGARLDPAALRNLRAFATAQRRRAERQQSRFRSAWRRFTRKRTRDEFRIVLQRLRALALCSD
jgi:CHAD domain-containing protein